MRIQELSISERIVLAEQLWDSIADADDEGAAVIELSNKQKAVLDERLNAFQEDQNMGSSWEEVKKRIVTH